MKQRITYINRPAEETRDPAEIPFENGVLSLRSWSASKQDRITFGFQELPQEIWQVLKQCEELHVRWVTERPYDAVAPFSSRISSGLHVFFTPGVEGESADGLCPLLQKISGSDLSCSPPEDTFITTPESSPSRPLQFYEALPSSNDLVTYIQRELCPKSASGCQERANSLSSADSIDIDYDSSSHSLVLSGYWSKSPEEHGWAEDIRKDGTGFEKVEVGLLVLEEATDPEELSVGGFIGVVGETDKLKPTLFSFPSRHHPLPRLYEFSTSFPEPTGLHPTMKLSFPERSPLEAFPPPPGYTCSLYTYVTLPSSIFADKYQLSTTDPLFLNSHNLLSLRSISGETDLEAPDWVVPRWGSTLLLELATPNTSTHQPGSLPWEITIPLHLRYLHPSPSGTRPVTIPWPIVFQACETDSDEEIGTNPFDRTHLGFESQFGPRTLFYYYHTNSPPILPHDVPRPSWERDLVEKIDVPVLKIQDGEEGVLQARRIELGTVVVVVVGFVWVLWKLGAVLWTSGVGRGDDVRRGGKETERKKKR